MKRTASRNVTVKVFRWEFGGKCLSNEVTFAEATVRDKSALELEAIS